MTDSETHARSTELYAMRRGDRLVHFYPSARLTDSCGTGPVVQVLVTTDANGAYWAWWDAARNEHRYVYSHRSVVETCFPDVDHAMKQGRGEIVQVRVDVLRDATEDDR